MRWNQTDRHVGRRVGALAGEGDRRGAPDAPGGASGRRQAAAHSGARNAVVGAVGEERIGCDITVKLEIARAYCIFA